MRTKIKQVAGARRLRYLRGFWRRRNERGCGKRERVEGALGGGVLGLAEGEEVLGALKGLAVEVYRRLGGRVKPGEEREKERLF